MQPAGTPADVIVTGVPPLQNLQFLLPYAQSPVFNPEVVVIHEPPGGTPSAAINNSNPLEPQLGLALVDGDPGTDGISPFTSLDASFLMPNVDTSVIITVGDTSWMTDGMWVTVSGAGNPSLPLLYTGGWLVVSAVLSPTSVTLLNPGAEWGFPTGIPTNRTPGTTILSFGTPNQIVVSGPPGPESEPGTSGLTPEIEIVYIVPVSPPVSAAYNLKLYFDVAPPGIPTIAQFYSWDGASWLAGPNFASTGGTLWFTGTADPNVAPPSGSKLLDFYIQFTGTNAVYYQRTAPSTWTIVGTVALLGTTTSVDTHTGGGAYTFDAAVFSFVIDTDSDIDLFADTTNYDGAGTWLFSIFNSDASPHDLSAGGLSVSGIPTLPLTIGAGETANVVLRRFTPDGIVFSNKFVIEQAYIVV